MIIVSFSLSSVPFHYATVCCYVCLCLYSHIKPKEREREDFQLVHSPNTHLSFFFLCLFLNFCACIRLIVYVRVLRLNHITLPTIFMSIQIPVYSLSQYPWSYDAINVYDCTLSICTRIVYNTKSNIQKKEKQKENKNVRQRLEDICAQNRDR